MSNRPESFEAIVADIKACPLPQNWASENVTQAEIIVAGLASRLEAERARSGRINVAALRKAAKDVAKEADVMRGLFTDAYDDIGDNAGTDRLNAIAAAIESALTGRFDDEEKEAMKAGAFWLSDEVIGSHESRKKWAATLRRMLDEEGA